ncbi:MAG: hypothetical protein IK086_00980 [Clostridia bacterium]|nr:hypothetical protein [Clostridia bacterium]
MSYAFGFSGDMCGGKTPCKRKSPLKGDFQGAGVVLAGVECSPKILRFLANGTSAQERVDFFDTLKNTAANAAVFFI